MIKKSLFSIIIEKLETKKIRSQIIIQNSKITKLNTKIIVKIGPSKAKFLSTNTLLKTRRSILLRQE